MFSIFRIAAFIYTMAIAFVITVQAQIDLSKYNINFEGNVASAASNTLEFQKAVNDAASSVDKSLLVSPGTIRLEGTLKVPSGLRITGAGIFSTVLSWNTSFNGYGFDGTNYTIENMRLTKVSELAAGAIRCNGGSCKVSFVEISDMWGNGIEARNCTAVEIGNCRILGSLSVQPNNSTSANIYITNSSNITIRDTHSRTGIHGIFIEGSSSDILIKTTSCTNSDYGIRFNSTTAIQDVLIDGADISGCNISSVLLMNVRKAEIRNAYGVVRYFDGSHSEGTFHVTGPHSDSITFNSVIVNNNNEKAKSSGIKIEEGNNIAINYFSSANTAYPIEVKSAATHVSINGAIRRDNDTLNYRLEAPKNVLIDEYTKYQKYK